MKDTVFITGLRAETTIGVRPRERLIKQTLKIDLVLYCDLSLAGISDDLIETLDYSGISAQVINLIENSDFLLIESIAEMVAGELLNDDQVKGIRVTIHKPGAVPAADDVGVTITRGNLPGQE